MSRITLTLTAQQEFEVPEDTESGLFAETLITDFRRWPHEFVEESEDSWEWEEC